MTCTLRELIDALPSPHLLAPAAESDRERLLDAPIRSVCCDSRAAGADSLFFCLRGMRSDGHDFASAAYRQGARAFVVEQPLPALPRDAAVIRVPDSRAALADGAAAFYGYPARSMRIVGITGTKGKTTTACLAAHILNRCGIPTGYIGTNGADFAGLHLPTVNSTPESLELHRILRRMLDTGVRTCVMEVSSQGLWMGRVRGIPFHACLFTNLSPDHIGGVEHPDYAHYRACKKSLFTDYPLGLALCNADDAEAAFMMGGVTSPVRGFSVSDKPAVPGGVSPDWLAADIRPVQRDGVPGMAFTVTAPGGSSPCFLPLPGVFNVSDALGALALCREGFGVPVAQAAEALADAAVPGRFETVTHPAQPGVTYIIDYAHNGLSLAAILDTLRAYRPTRLICLFGSVGERTTGRRAELALAAANRADLCILTSDNPGCEPPEDIIREIDASFPPGACPRLRIPDRADAIRAAVALARPGDMILLAGKGHEDYQLIGTSRLPFREREILTAALDACSTAKANV